MRVGGVGVKAHHEGHEGHEGVQGESKTAIVSISILLMLNA